MICVDEIKTMLGFIRKYNSTKDVKYLILLKEYLEDLFDGLGDLCEEFEE